MSSRFIKKFCLQFIFLPGFMATASLAHGGLIVPNPIITPTPVLAGSPVTVTNNVTGGTPTYTWSVHQSVLPVGLSLNATTGEISGIPQQSGNADFTLKVQDSSTPVKQIVYKRIQFPITPDAPVLPPAILKTAKVGDSYSYTFNATGGKMPYTWSTTSALPSSLVLDNSTAILSGTPTQAAAPNATVVYPITIKVTGSNNQTASRIYNLSVAPIDPPNITTPPLNSLNGFINTPFTPVLQAAGGVLPYTWSNIPNSDTSKNLPTGLTLNMDGSFTGNPTVTGVFDVAFLVTDANGRKSNSKILRIIVSDGDLRIKTQSIPSAQAEIPYPPLKLEAAGGFPPYQNWRLTNRGTLPSTFEVSSNGTMSGNASAPGTYTFTVGVSDSINATATKDFSLRVVPYDLVISGSSISGNKCSTINATYVVTGGVAPYTWSPTPVLPATLSFSANGAVAKISGNLTSPAGNYSVNLQATDKNGKSATKPLSITINALPTFEWLTTANLTDGNKSSLYSAPLNVSGGLAPYKFSLKLGSTLPAGLSINPTTGFISGTPTTAGNHTFTVIAKESSCEALSIEKTFNLQIFDAIVLIGTSISGNKCSTITPMQLAVTGGAPPYTWSTTPSPIVPSSLTINATTGVISGSLTSAAGNYSVLVKATDKNGKFAAATLGVKIIAQPPFVWVTSANLTAGYVSTNYTNQISISGGIAPYTYALKAGSDLPPGLTLNSTTDLISGTPTTAGNYTFTVIAKESSCEALSIERTFNLQIFDAMVVSGPSISGNKCSTIASANYTVTGGVAPYTWTTIPSPIVPSALVINATTGVISGNLTSAAGNYSVVVQATDKNGKSASKTVSVTINALPPFNWVTTANLTGGYVSTPYTGQLSVSGGIAPYKYALKAGSVLPPTLTLNTTTGAISGTPTTAGNYTFTVIAKESSCEALSIERTFNLQIFDAMVVSGPSISGNKCSTIASANYTVTGGVAPYTWTTIPSPIVPSALVINATTGVISGNLTSAAGNYSVVVQATDKNGKSASKTVSVTINALPPFNWVTTANLTGGYVSTPYTGQLSVSGGIAPYTYALKAGSVLPPTLTLNTTTGAISGTPTTAGNYTFTVIAKESSCEALSIERTFNLQIFDAMVVSGPSISGNKCSTIASANYTVTGGVAPYTWTTIPSPIVPSALVINATTGVISGNLTSAAGNYSVVVQATDKNGKSASKTVSVTINALPPFNWVTTANLTGGYVSTPYTGQLSVSGGIAPYKYALKAGSVLPPTLTLNTTTGAISGTPTTAGNYTFTVIAKESSCEALSIERTFNLQIFDAMVVSGPSISGNKCSTIASANYTVTGGVAPYTWTTIPSPIVPSALVINATTGVISGNLTSAAGNYSVVVQATDKNGKSASKTVSVTINALPPFNWVTTANLTGGYVSTPYTGQLSVSGGIAPYTYALKAGSVLPPTLTLNTTTGAISGTPTTAGNYTFTVIAKESSCEALSIERTFNLQILDPMVVSGPPINGSKCSAITPAQFTVTGGVAPYTWTTIPSPIVPSALAINATTGVISGVITGNAGNYSVVVKATDKNGRTATCTSNITISNPSSLNWVTSTTLPDGYVNAGYTSILSVSGGTSPYTYTLINGTMPNSLTLNRTSGAISGNLTTAGNYTFCVRAVDACAQQVERCFIIKVIKNVILNCVKEIWVVVDYSDVLWPYPAYVGNGYHRCSDAEFTIKANGESIMIANLSNNGTYTACAKIHQDYVATPSGKPNTFIYPHPEFTSDIYARYNRVLVNGANLTTIAAKSPSGIVTFSAECNYAPCSSAYWTVGCHDPVGRLRIYTTNSTAGIFSQSWTPIGGNAKFSTTISEPVTICQNSTIALPQALATAGSLRGVPTTLLVDAKKMSPNLSAQEIAKADHLVVQPFKVGRTEVTNQEYCDFLNAVASQADPYGLYNAAMGSGLNGGIVRTGTDGADVYSVKAGMGNYPVVYVSWFDAARYVNWLSNGSPTGVQDKTTTEEGAYALNGAVSGVGIARNESNPNTEAEPKYWLLNEGEWYTSAYLKASELNSVAFWSYPTNRDIASDVTLNDIRNLANCGNIFDGPTEVGFFSESPSPFGTLDQGGNVREWTESVDSGTYRIIRGGSWADTANSLKASESDVADPTLEDDKTGFRIGRAP